MCDYSAENVKSRKAAKGDRLMSSAISQHTIGFVDPKQPDTAVCLLPGTELGFSKELMIDRHRAMQSGKDVPATCKHTTAQFVQVELDNKHTHHDALRFPDGAIVKMNWLIAGQEARVLQTPVGEHEHHRHDNVGAVFDHERPVERQVTHA